VAGRRGPCHIGAYASEIGRDAVILVLAVVFPALRRYRGGTPEPS
jgi:hypothetical protein